VASQRRLRAVHLVHAVTQGLRPAVFPARLPPSTTGGSSILKLSPWRRNGPPYSLCTRRPSSNCCFGDVVGSGRTLVIVPRAGCFSLNVSTPLDLVHALMPCANSPVPVRLVPETAQLPVWIVVPVFPYWTLCIQRDSAGELTRYSCRPMLM